MKIPRLSVASAGFRRTARLELKSEGGLHASLAAALGDVGAARGYASGAEPALSEGGDAVGITHLRIAIATLELSLGDPDSAWQTLARSTQRTRAQRNFVLVRVFPYAIEALVELGQLKQAAALAQGLEEAESILARWRGPALRARALVHEPSDRDRALALFDAALDADERLGSGFERARTLFARGRVLRRWQRRRMARESLKAALMGFERWVRGCGRSGSRRSSNERRHAERSTAS